MRDVWLSRHDHAIEEEQKARRKGRPKSVKESDLENLKLMEAEQYRTGFGESTARRTLNYAESIESQSCQT